jgi:hypothetical protein
VPLATPFADDYFPPPDSKGGWRTLTDPATIAKTAGVDRQKLDEAFDYVQNTSQHGGLLVVRHGYLVYERYSANSPFVRNAFCQNGTTPSRRKCEIVLGRPLRVGLSRRATTPA